LPAISASSMRLVQPSLSVSSATSIAIETLEQIRPRNQTARPPAPSRPCPVCRQTASLPWDRRRGHELRCSASKSGRAPRHECARDPADWDPEPRNLPASHLRTERLVQARATPLERQALRKLVLQKRPSRCASSAFGRGIALDGRHGGRWICHERVGVRTLETASAVPFELGGNSSVASSILAAISGVEPSAGTISWRSPWRAIMTPSDDAPLVPDFPVLAAKATQARRRASRHSPPPRSPSANPSELMCLRYRAEGPFAGSSIHDLGSDRPQMAPRREEPAARSHDDSRVLNRGGNVSLQRAAASRPSCSSSRSAT
jgi:hypothetical protein